MDATTEQAAAGALLVVDEDENDSKECVLQRYFLQEWEFVKSILGNIVINAGASDPANIRKIRTIMDKYQEQGQLLEPYLESIISPLMLIIRSRAVQVVEQPEESLEIIKPLCIIIYTLVTVCGYKSVVKFFPHQVSDLQLAVALLEKCHLTTSDTSLRHESTGEMETKCVTLLWLYILVLIPFDIASVDSSSLVTETVNPDEPTPLVVKILDMAKDYLASAGPMRGISGLLLSRLLTRPDMSKPLSSFMEWAHEVLSFVAVDTSNQFRLLGVMEALACIFKVGSRKMLLNLVNTTWSDISQVMKSKTAARSSLLRKYVVKLSQRIGVTCLPHRLPKWRYLGGDSVLQENILAGTAQKRRPLELIQTEEDSQICGCLNEEDMDVPEIVEDIIESLLSGLRDSDTVVRWSAAKGIGRITLCLTSSLAEDVLSSILDLFSPGEGDGSWHGGCLALAELARRGLLLPANLPKVVPVVIKALHYDIRRGPHSIGSHVRDAAAYVCWAFGRAYSNSDMKGTLEQLAPHLLTVACYDREVNCRRAASAAFQENVGRQGDFPHGIDIVNAADYFSLSSRGNSYLQVAVYIAQYPGYLRPFVEELLCSKIPHWDKNLRELAAEALSALARYDLDYFGGYVLERLVPCTLSSDLFMRHGATLAAGELALTLYQHGYGFSTEKHKSLSSVVPAIEKARLYRGKGGEIMRACVSRFIECISLAKISLGERTKRSLLDTLTENLKHPNAHIQHVAVNALKQFIPVYLVASKFASELVSRYLELLDDPNVAARRGSALALGILPYEFLAVKWRDVIAKLSLCCTIEHKPDDPDAEARVNAVHGLVSVCETLSRVTNNESEEAATLYFLIKGEVMQALFKSLDDYATDNRGDIGSWVREAAIGGLERCSHILCERDYFVKRHSQLSPELPKSSLDTDVAVSPFFDTNMATRLIGGIAKQAVEKMDKLREIAAKTLQRLLYYEKCFIHFIPHRETLEVIIPNVADIEWGVATVSYPRFVKFLNLSCYSKLVLSGLVISVGGLQESLRKASVTALVDYIFHDSEAETDGNRNKRECMLSADILWVLQEYKKCDRVIIPTFKTVEILLSKRVFLDMEGNVLDFGTQLLDSVAAELRGSKDFSKLCTGISILGYYASSTRAINLRAFHELLSFLGHRYPKIRKAAADQIYLILLQNENLVSEDKLERAIEVLSESCWDGALEEAKHRRTELVEIVGLQGDSTIKTSSKEMNNQAEKKVAFDENSSYSSLVEFTGF